MKFAAPRDVMAGFLTIILVGAFQLALFWLLNYNVPEANEQLVVFMLGQLSVMASMGPNFYLGTSKSSRDKNVMLSRQMQKPSPSEEDAPPRDLPDVAFGKQSGDNP